MWKAARRILGGLTGVGLLTLVCFAFHLNLAPTGFLYLLVVVAQALTSGFLSAAIICLFAAGALNYFFAPPIMSLRVTDPLDILALITYLTTALVVSHLSSKAQQEARVAESRANEMRLLYEAALQLIALDPEMAEHRCLEIFQTMFGLTAASIFYAPAGKSVMIGNSLGDLAEKTRNSCSEGQDFDDPVSDIYIRCFRFGGPVSGAVGFEGGALSSSVVGSLSVLAAMVIERARTFRMKSEAAAAAEAEVLRSAILDALAHEFKGPLATTLAAVGGLAETGPLNDKQSSLADLIETQMWRLNRLTGRLLRTAQLDKSEIRPQMVPTDIADLVTAISNAYRSDFIHVAPVLTHPREPVEVLADRELLSLALIQLIDNAFKYSRSGGPVTLDISRDSDTAVIRITNRGSSIPQEDRERIFDRFYRGQQAGGHIAGTGLGLFVSRKIVVAHDGSLELESAETAEDTTVFCIRLKTVETGLRGVRRAG